MASPGITKTVTLSNAWQRLGALYNPDNQTFIKEGEMMANQVFISVSSYGAEFAFADGMPDVELVSQGHAMAAGDSVSWNNKSFIARAWFRNDTAGSNAVLTISPIFE